MAAIARRNSSKFQQEKENKFLGKQIAGLPASSLTLTRHVTPQQNTRTKITIKDQAPKK